MRGVKTKEESILYFRTKRLAQRREQLLRALRGGKEHCNGGKQRDEARSLEGATGRDALHGAFQCLLFSHITYEEVDITTEPITMA